MALRLDAVKAAMQAALRTPVPPDVRVEARESASLAVLVGINALLVADPEPASGWLRAALIVTDTRRRYALDSIGANVGDICLLRCETFLDLMDVTTVGGMSDVHGAINDAISVGAPRYNGGDVRGCCTIYWAAAQALVSAPVFRGFPGHARALASLRSVLDTEPTQKTFNDDEVDQLAWTLRRALDAALAVN